MFRLTLLISIISLFWGTISPTVGREISMAKQYSYATKLKPIQISGIPYLKKLPSNHVLNSRPACDGVDELVAATTKNYFISICSDSSRSGPATYEGYAKNPRGGYIILPLRSYNNCVPE